MFRIKAGSYFQYSSLRIWFNEGALLFEMAAASTRAMLPDNLAASTPCPVEVYSAWQSEEYVMGSAGAVNLDNQIHIFGKLRRVLFALFFASCRQKYVRQVGRFPWRLRRLRPSKTRMCP